MANHKHSYFMQCVLFLIVGAIQLAFDTSIFIASTALGAPVIVGNVVGRISGALFGYWLNGRYTFPTKDPENRPGQRLRRFTIAWLMLTFISTTVMAILASHQELHNVWIAKPVVEALLAAVGFIVWRQWVFR